MTNDKEYMREYMRYWREDRKLAPRTIIKECVNCGTQYNEIPHKGRAKYCLDCKIIAISGNKKKLELRRKELNER